MNMSTPPPASWPPIIEFARAPWYVRVRDIVLTLAAWAVFLYMLRNAIAIVIDYFSNPIFKLTKTNPPTWAQFWEHMDAFVKCSAGAVVWLTFWGIIQRHQLRLAIHATPPHPLPLEKHAASFQLDPASVEQWRELKIALVQFDASNRIASVTPPGGTDSR